MFTLRTITIEEHYRHGYRFHGHCEWCGRTRDLDLVELAKGFGWSAPLHPLIQKVACMACGHRALRFVVGAGLTNKEVSAPQIERVIAETKRANVVEFRRRRP